MASTIIFFSLVALHHSAAVFLLLVSLCLAASFLSTRQDLGLLFAVLSVAAALIPTPVIVVSALFLAAVAFLFSNAAGTSPELTVDNILPPVDHLVEPPPPEEADPPVNISDRPVNASNPPVNIVVQPVDVVDPPKPYVNPYPGLKMKWLNGRPPITEQRLQSYAAAIATARPPPPKVYPSDMVRPYT